jgi:hypothetical protein
MKTNDFEFVIIVSVLGIILLLNPLFYSFKKLTLKITNADRNLHVHDV